MDTDDHRTFFREMECILLDFMRSRENTMHVLVEIWLEVQDVSRRVNKTQILSKSVSILTGVASMALIAATPVTGGLSAPGSVALVGISGASAAASLGVTVYQKIVEKGLIQKVRVVLDDDRKTSERLNAAAGALRDLAILTGDTSSFLVRAGQLGVTTAREVNIVLKVSDVSVSTLQIATNLTKIADRVNTFIKVAGPLLVAISIPLDILSVIYEIRDCRDGRYADTAIAIWDRIMQLQQEYVTAKEMFRNLVYVMADD